MNKLEIIQLVNPEWGILLQCFLMDYPEFKPYSYRLPMSPSYPLPFENVNTLFQAIFYYICASGVNFNYALKQWEYIYPLINTNNWEELCERVMNFRADQRIQPKKREIYYNICEFMKLQNLTHNTIQPDNVSLLKENVKGIGVGCIAWIKKHFTSSDDCVEYTDIYFKKGFKILYKNDTLKMRKNKADEWKEKGYGRLANYMVLGIA